MIDNTSNKNANTPEDKIDEFIQDDNNKGDTLASPEGEVENQSDLTKASVEHSNPNMNNKTGWSNWSEQVFGKPDGEMPVFIATGHYDETPKIIPRRNFLSDMPDKGLFSLAAIIGFILIVAGKVSGLSIDLIVILAIVTMLTYGIISYRMQAVRLRLDRLGDNFYYLGFIYTLASISSALIQLKRNYDVNIIIDSFGIALFTTIIGIAGRVIFIQMRTEVDDLERAVRQELVASANELRGQLHASVRDFGNFRIGIQQTIREGLDNSLGQFKETAEAVIFRLDQTFNNYNDRALEFSNVSEKMLTIGHSIEERLAKLELPSDAITKKLDGVVTGLENAAKNFSTVVKVESDGISSLKKVNDSIVNIKESISAFDQQLKIHSQTLTNLNSPTSELVNNIANLNIQIDKVALHFEAEIVKFSSISQAATEIQKGISEQLQESKEAVGEVQKAMAETAMVIAKYVSEKSNSKI